VPRFWDRVDRVDYTKGIPERFRAIERFFEKYRPIAASFTLCRSVRPAALKFGAIRN